MSTGSQMQHSSLPRNLSFKMAIQPEPFATMISNWIFRFMIKSQRQLIPLANHILKWHAKVKDQSGEESINIKTLGSPVMQRNTEVGDKKSTFSSHDFTSLPSHFDYEQPIGAVPFTYPDNYYPGMLAAYGPHAMVHPQMMCMTPARVPLPLDLPQDEPIFVNARQYHAIMRRRQYRAKLEAQNKVSRDRKPYLHESRHRHALNRARGPGGRFLNVKKVQESVNAISDGQYHSGFGISHSIKNIWGAETHKTENYKEPNPASGSSGGITCVSNADTIYPQQDYGFSVYASPDYEESTRLGVGCFHGGTQHFLQVPQ